MENYFFYQKGYLITINNKKYIVKGCHSYGKSIVCTNNIKNFDFGIKKVEKIFHTKTIY